MTDNVPQRFHLDTVWDEDPIQYMLEQYNWIFAQRTYEWNYNSAIEPDFGYDYVFDKPSDYVRLSQISADEYFSNPLRDYDSDGDYFYCNHQTIYLKYVSNDTSYGKDYSKFTKSFEHMVATYMASQIAMALNKSKDDKQMLDAEMRKLALAAKNIDYMETPTRFPPQSSWGQARRSGRRGDSGRGPVFG